MRAGIIGWTLLLILSACGDGLGPPCNREGSIEDCGLAEICAKVQGDLYCQPTCDSAKDCGVGERCRDVKDREGACIPVDDDDDDGIFIDDDD